MRSDEWNPEKNVLWVFAHHSSFIIHHSSFPKDTPFPQPPLAGGWPEREIGGFRIEIFLRESIGVGTMRIRMEFHGDARLLEGGVEGLAVMEGDDGIGAGVDEEGGGRGFADVQFRGELFG